MAQQKPEDYLNNTHIYNNNNDKNTRTHAY